MIQSGDLAGRLRLFRYGLVVLVVITFLVSLFAPYSYITAYLRPASATGTVDAPPITQFLGQALIYTVAVAILAVIVYFGYRYWLERSVAKS
jgi:hypothetical protein